MSEWWWEVKKGPVWDTLNLVGRNQISDSDAKNAAMQLEFFVIGRAQMADVPVPASDERGRMCVSLHIEERGFGDAGASAILEQLCKLHIDGLVVAKELYMFKLRLTDKIIPTLSDLLVAHKGQVEAVHLSHNEITTAGAQSLVNSIASYYPTLHPDGKCTPLWLRLEQNKINGIALNLTNITYSVLEKRIHRFHPGSDRPLVALQIPHIGVDCPTETRNDRWQAKYNGDHRWYPCVRGASTGIGRWKVLFLGYEEEGWQETQEEDIRKVALKPTQRTQTRNTQHEEDVAPDILQADGVARSTAADIMDRAGEVLRTSYQDKMGTRNGWDDANMARKLATQASNQLKHSEENLRCRCDALWGEALMRLSYLQVLGKKYDDVFHRLYKPAVDHIKEARIAADALFARALGAGEGSGGGELENELGMCIQMVLDQSDRQKDTLSKRRANIENRLRQSQEERDRIMAKLGEGRGRSQKPRADPSQRSRDHALNRKQWLDEVRAITNLRQKMDTLDPDLQPFRNGRGQRH